jgi:hypothetical protein
MFDLPFEGLAGDGFRNRRAVLVFPRQDGRKSGMRKRAWGIVAVVIMLAAILAYIASLDDSDPDAMPAAVEDAGAGAP